MKKISVIIPAKNEEETIGAVLDDLNQTIAGMPNYQVELICVDDHCTDATATIARSFGAKIVENTGKPGKGMALRDRTMIRPRSGAIIGTMKEVRVALLGSGFVAGFYMQGSRK